MKWLVWKEYRANRLVLIVGAALALAPYLILLGLLWGPLRRGAAELSWLLACAAVYSAGISQLTLALLGGNVIAGERADRSAEFLAYLPISRARALAAKLTLVASTAALIWIPNLLIAWLASACIPEKMRSLYTVELIGRAIPHAAITGAVFFSVAWLLSSILESPTFSVCGGLITPVLIMSAVYMVCWPFGIPEDVLGSWWLGISLVLAPACFVAGTAYYLRRVEP